MEPRTKLGVSRSLALFRDKLGGELDFYGI